MTRRLTPVSLREPFSRSPVMSMMLAACVLAATLALSVAFAQAPSAGPSPAPFAGAMVSAWKGQVRLQLPGANMLPPRRGQVLPEDTVLDTGDGRMVLVLRDDESEILIEPHTRLIVRKPAPVVWNSLDLLLGRIHAYIRKRTGGAQGFQMGTPSAVIAVRGTRFDVEVNRRGATEVDVFEGLVEVAAAGLPGTSVLVRPGFSARVGGATAPEGPVPIREMRPDFLSPDRIAKLEFSRERASRTDRGVESELGERRDSELDELVDESREAEKGKR